MTTKITATYSTDHDESTTRTLTTDVELTERIVELVGLGLIAELELDDALQIDIDIHRSVEPVHSLTDPAPPVHTYSIGDMVEVLASGRSHDDPPIGCRAQIIDIDEGPEFPVRIAWKGMDWWCRLSEIKPAPDDHELRVGDLVEVVARGHDDPPLGYRAEVLRIYRVCDESYANIAWPDAPYGQVKWQMRAHKLMLVERATDVVASVDDSLRFYADAAVETLTALGWKDPSRGFLSSTSEWTSLWRRDGYSPTVGIAPGVVAPSSDFRDRLTVAEVRAFADLAESVRSTDVQTDANDGRIVDDTTSSQLLHALQCCEHLREKLEHMTLQRDKALQQLEHTTARHDDLSKPVTDDDIEQLFDDRKSSQAREIVQQKLAHRQIAVGDTVEVIGRSHYDNQDIQDPPIAYRAVVNNVMDDGVCINWNGKSGWFMCWHEVKRVDSAESPTG